MSRFSDWLGSVLAELRRRNVLQVGAGYAVAAWVAFQVAAIVLRDALFLPPWVLTLVVVIGILGFPVALFLAWRYDITPDGIRRAEPRDAGDATAEPARHRVAVALTVVTLVATTGAGWTAMRAWSAARGDPGSSARKSEPLEASTLDPRRIAVLPFRVEAFGGSDEYDLGGVASGFTAALIDELGSVDGLELVSRTGVEPYRNRAVPLDSVARSLRAGTLIEGRVERTADSLVLAAHLVDGATDRRLGSVRLAEPKDSLLALRSSLVQAVARELRKELGEEIRLRQLRAGSDDTEAWRAVHGARELRLLADTLAVSQDTGSARRLLAQADSLLAKAETLDPDWIDPTVDRAWIALFRAQLGRRSSAERDPVWLRAGESRATAALDAAPGHAGALEVRGVLRYRASKSADLEAPWASLDSAEADLRRAVDADPERSRAWAELSRLLQDRNRFGEARMAASRSVAADPFLTNDVHFLWSSAELALQLKEFEKAERLARRGRQLFPNESAWDVFLLTLLAGPQGPTPSPDSAWAILGALEEKVGAEWPQARLLVGGALARVGLSDSARAVLERATAKAPDRPFTHYNGANVLLQLGQPDSAVALLSRYLEAFPDRRASLADDWWFDDLHGRPGFERLISPSERP